MSLWRSLVSQLCFKADCLGHTPSQEQAWSTFNSLGPTASHGVSQHHSKHNTHTSHILWYLVDLYLVALWEIIKNIPVGSKSMSFHAQTYIFLEASDCGMIVCITRMAGGCWIRLCVWDWALNLDLLSRSTRSRSRLWPLCHMTCKTERSPYPQHQTMRCLGEGMGSFWDSEMLFCKSMRAFSGSLKQKTKPNFAHTLYDHDYKCMRAESQEKETTLNWFWRYLTWNRKKTWACKRLQWLLRCFRWGFWYIIG